MKTIEELSKLSHDQLCIECAKSHHGWVDFDFLYWCEEEIDPKWEGRRLHGATSQENHWHLVPDYPVDLNAMHEAEKTLTEQQRADYADELFHLTDPVYQIGVTDDGDPDLATDMCKWLTATARQRCMAFILTKSRV